MKSPDVTSLVCCPLGHGDAPVLFQVKDENRRVSGEQFRYRCCRTCALIFLENRPDDLSPFYGEGYYELPSLSELERSGRHVRFEVDLLLRHTAPGRLVEIGPAWGIFASEATRAGFTVQAIEMDPRCCTYLRDVVGIAAVNSAEPEKVLVQIPPSESIVLWQVIEHLTDPWACLEAAVQNLEPGGILVVATPNPESLGFRVLRERWPHVDAPRHFFLLPVDLLATTLALRGMELVYLTMNDKGARKWNRFGWQRFLMNRVRSRPFQILAWGIGLAVSLVMWPLEQSGRNGSSYTAVFRKITPPQPSRHYPGVSVGRRP